MKILPIVWQRLVNEHGSTCPRCGETGEEVVKAVERLKPILQHLGVEPQLETREIDVASFQERPMISNVILINGQPMEYWFKGEADSSPCCGACGDNNCRTIKYDGKTYESIPEELIVRAGVIAGAKLIHDPS